MFGSSKCHESQCSILLKYLEDFLQGEAMKELAPEKLGDLTKSSKTKKRYHLLLKKQMDAAAWFLVNDLDLDDRKVMMLVINLHTFSIDDFFILSLIFTPREQ